MRMWASRSCLQRLPVIVVLCLFSRGTAAQWQGISYDHHNVPRSEEYDRAYARQGNPQELLVQSYGQPGWAYAPIDQFSQSNVDSQQWPSWNSVPLLPRANQAPAGYSDGYQRPRNVVLFPIVGGWIYSRRLNAYYKMFYNGHRTFDESEKLCVGEGGHLVSVHSDAENNFILKVRGLQALDPVYLGLKSDFGNPYEFKWTDSSLLVYVNFKNPPVGNPNGGAACVAMEWTGVWKEIDCRSALGIVCKRTRRP